MHLQNLQLEFAESLLTNEQQLDFILPAQNIRIYQQHVISHLIQALSQTYPLVLKLVGDDFFQIAAKAYSKQYPSRSGDLNEYGEYFSDFLAEYQPVKELIYLAEVAQFEWTCHVLLSASSHVPTNVDFLKKISPEQYDQLYFDLHPACRVMKFYYPMLRIIELSAGEIDDTIDFGEDGVNLLIIRRDLDISLVPLTVSEFTFLAALQENKSLAEALTATIEADPTFVLDEKLSSWIQDQTIVNLGLIV